MEAHWKQRWTPWAVGLGVGLLYFALPSFHHNFDGVACAAAVELGELKNLVHGNHILYGITGLLFHRFLGGLGAGLSSLWSLQVFDSLLGAAGAGLFCSLLLRLRFSSRIAVFCSTGMALSFGYWFWSLEAQVYALGVVLLLMSLAEAVREKPRPYRLAFWHGLAMLSHGANVLFTPVAVYNLWRSCSKEDRKRVLGTYLVAAAGLVLLVYLLAGSLIMRPSSIEELRVWLLGSAALGLDRGFEWHGHGSFRNYYDWFRLSGTAVSAWPWLGLPLWGAGAWAALNSEGQERVLCLSAWLWLGAYALLFTQWEPYTLVYRVSDLVPLWLLGAVAASRAARAKPFAWAGVGLLGLLAAVNLWAGILPAAKAENNKDLMRAQWIKGATPEDAWVLARDSDEVYIPYFAHRHPLNLRFFRGDSAALAGRIWQLMEAGHPVFVVSRGQRSHSSLPAFLRLAEASRRDGSVLYRIIGVAE